MVMLYVVLYRSRKNGSATPTNFTESCSGCPPVCTLSCLRHACEAVRRSRTFILRYAAQQTISHSPGVAGYFEGRTVFQPRFQCHRDVLRASLVNAAPLWRSISSDLQVRPQLGSLLTETPTHLRALLDRHGRGLSCQQVIVARRCAVHLLDTASCAGSTISNLERQSMAGTAVTQRAWFSTCNRWCVGC